MRRGFTRRRSITGRLIKLFICLLILSVRGFTMEGAMTGLAKLFIPDWSALNNSALWVDAIYTEDTTLGTGAKTLLVEVIAGETAITFTIKTACERFTITT